MIMDACGNTTPAQALRSSCGVWDLSGQGSAELLDEGENGIAFLLEALCAQLCRYVSQVDHSIRCHGSHQAPCFVLLQRRQDLRRRVRSCLFCRWPQVNLIVTPIDPDFTAPVPGLSGAVPEVVDCQEPCGSHLDTEGFFGLVQRLQERNQCHDVGLHRCGVRMGAPALRYALQLFLLHLARSHQTSAYSLGQALQRIRIPIQASFAQRPNNTVKHIHRSICQVCHLLPPFPSLQKINHLGFHVFVPLPCSAKI
mmetsp:Transcript_44037/g.80848  ORF Transcript_44037/g.80848 Transcript_44037/m.80848 type:complete len:254 (+) Transcript_44037:1-762(+)